MKRRAHCCPVGSEALITTGMKAAAGPSLLQAVLFQHAVIKWKAHCSPALLSFPHTVSA